MRISDWSSDVCSSDLSGAFHVAKPSDLLPELQGRLPIRVELGALSEEDFVRILSETKAGLPEQYAALLGTEGVTLNFSDDAIARVAKLAAEVNEKVEIGRASCRERVCQYV